MEFFLLKSKGITWFKLCGEAPETQQPKTAVYLYPKNKQGAIPRPAKTPSQSRPIGFATTPATKIDGIMGPFQT